MSWDLYFANFPLSIQTPKDIPEDFMPADLCARAYYEHMVLRLFPDIDENGDRSWMILEGETYSIEFNAGTGDALDSLMLHVRGDEAALAPIKKICDYTGWRAIDTTSGDFIDFNANPDKGFAQWRDFRNSCQPENADLRGIKLAIRPKRWWQFWK